MSLVMTNLFALFPEPQGAKQSSSSTDVLLEGALPADPAASQSPLSAGSSSQPGVAPAPAAATPASPGNNPSQSVPAATSAAVSSAAATQSSGAAASQASAAASAGSAAGSTANAANFAGNGAPPFSGNPDNSGGVSLTPPSQAVSIGPAEPDFDGLLVSWNPGSIAEERANARAALGMLLRETIHTRAMQAEGAGPLEVLDLPAGQGAEQAIEQLMQRPGVRFVEKNWLLQTQATSNDPAVANGSTWGLYGESSSPANAFGSQARRGLDPGLHRHGQRGGGDH
jgi:hypothetical protein